MKLKSKFMIPLLTILILGAVSMMAVVYYSSYENTLQQATQDRLVWADAIQEAVYGLLSIGQQQYLDAYLEKSRKIRNAQEIRVIRSEALEKELGVKESSRATDDLDQQVLRTGHEIKKEVTVEGKRAIRRISPILTNNSCLTCHTSFKENELIGALNTTLIFQSSLDHVTQNILLTGLLEVVVILLVIVVILMMFNKSVMNPLMKVRAFIKKMDGADGAPAIDMRPEHRKMLLPSQDKMFPIDPEDEIGELAVVFNKMSQDLQKTTASLKQLEQEIEKNKQAIENLKKEPEK